MKPQLNVYLENEKIRSEIVAENPIIIIPKNIYPEKINHQKYDDFLESRVPDKRREDMPDILKRYNIPVYNPIWMIKKSYGRNMNDFLWIKINNEDIDFEEIRLR